MKAWSKWLTRLFCLIILVDVVGIASSYGQHRLLDQFETALAVNDTMLAAAESNDLRQQVVAGLQVFLWICAMIASLTWIRSANQSARARGAVGMRFTPNWSIGWYFIPIASLWMPYQAMKEIWQAGRGGDAWKEDQVPDFFPIWWFVWLFNIFVSKAVLRNTLNTETIAELKHATVIAVASDAASIVLYLMFLSVVREVCRRHTSDPSKESDYNRPMQESLPG
ncbi:DUF4328 domain-containing protein [Sinorhizobium medicae]|uniref:DUF4328 domain-containing protein n=1 Tax=Sinorhizobium medicae TaxID=110321 RepID=UPI001297D4AC|nr:DUF4328 domain-containing protein [Sinorhizobium medicae]MQX48232.1 DUF4328 domain-containing protein [Sinorhizobium medicae]